MCWTDESGAAETSRMVITPTPRASRAHPPGAAHVALLVAATAMAPAAWGTTYAVTTEFLPPDQPMFSALMRSLPGGLVLVLATRCLPRGDWWWKAAALGALNIGG